MTNWKIKLREITKEHYGSLQEEVLEAFVGSQRLEVLRECASVYDKYEPNRFPRDILGEWFLRGDLDQEKFDSLIKEFNL